MNSSHTAHISIFLRRYKHLGSSLSLSHTHTHAWLQQVLRRYKHLDLPTHTHAQTLRCSHTQLLLKMKNICRLRHTRADRSSDRPHLCVLARRRSRPLSDYGHQQTAECAVTRAMFAKTSASRCRLHFRLFMFIRLPSHRHSENSVC